MRVRANTGNPVILLPDEIYTLDVLIRLLSIKNEFSSKEEKPVCESSPKSVSIKSGKSLKVKRKEFKKRRMLRNFLATI